MSTQIKNSNRKCGEITYCIQVGKRVYALNCLYCSQICLQWDIFINHMEQKHDDKLNLDSVLNVEDNVTELQENLMQNEYSKMLQQNTNYSLFNETNDTERLPFNDPLEDENSINSMSVESSIKVENLDYLSHQTMIESNIGNDKIEIDKNNDKMDFNTQFTHIDDNQDVEFSIKKDIREIKEKLETNNRLVKQLFEEIKLIQHNSIPHISNTTKILPKTPFENKEAFLKFETKIQESEENFAKLVKELKERVNGNSSKFIKNCWRLLIKDEVAKEFCWQGSKEKTEIKNFSTLLAIKQSYAQKYTDHNATEFERVVIMHFQQAKNRCEKKIKPQF